MRKYDVRVISSFLGFGLKNLDPSKMFHLDAENLFGWGKWHPIPAGLFYN